MAVTAATKISDFSGFLPRELAGPIFERAAMSSVVMQLVPQTPLGINGKSIPVVTGKPVANWVAEGAAKPASKGTLALKNMDPKKLAAIVVTSAEVVRANPGGYISNLRSQLAEAFAIAFDLATLHNIGGDGTGTGPFASYIDQTTKSAELGANSQANGGVYKDFVDAAQELIGDKDANNRRYRATGFALDSVVEMRIRGAVDTTGHPLWTDLPLDNNAPVLNARGSLLGRQSYIGEGVANPTETIVGYVGEWNQAVWGVIGGINYDVSDVATVTVNGALTSLWENNLVAVRAEAEYGFLVNDVDAFVQLRNDAGS